MGESYSQSIEESPYTRDMKEIDKDYLKIFLMLQRMCQRISSDNATAWCSG